MIVMINRQEVAKLLRKAGKNAGDWCDSADEAFEKVDTIIGTYDSCKYSDFFNRLADLIDPTCHLALDEELSQEFQGEMFRCSKCGAAFPRINGEYRYCPSCGARVVRE